MDNRDIDIYRLIDEMTLLIDSGMLVCLNVSTGETVYAPVESIDADGSDPLAAAYTQARSQWDDKVEVWPVDLQDEIEVMEYFISDNVREGTRLHQRLTAALASDNPVEAFRREIVLCKGNELWGQYRARAVRSMVVAEIVEAIGIPNVKTYPLDLDTLYLMAKAHVTKRYVYVSGRTVIISQVPDRTRLDPDTYMPIDDDYTIREWAMRQAEQQVFDRTGGGLVYEPMGMYEGYEVALDKVDLDQVVEELKRAVRWSDDEKCDFDDYCALEQTVDDLWGSTIDDYPDDYDSADIEFVSPSQERRNQPDGKYPIPGKPDDEFSDDNPWGFPRIGD